MRKRAHLPKTKPPPLRLRKSGFGENVQHVIDLRMVGQLHEREAFKRCARGDVGAG
jgi:hypothetical protein